MKLLFLALILTLLTPQSRAAEPPTKIISYNVWNGFSKAPERKPAWLHWMAEQNPDIVALQELKRYTPEQLQLDAAAWNHPHSVLSKEDGFPTGLTSRTPITDVTRIKEGFHHGLLRCRTAGLIIYVIHFHPSDWQFRINETKLLLDDVAQLSTDDQHRVIFIGDFNGFSPNEKAHLEKDSELEIFFKQLDEQDASNNLNEGKLDYAGIQMLLDAGYTDLIHAFQKADAPYPGTFPTKARPDENMGRDRRLDFVFIPKSSNSQARSAQVIRNDITATLSDHYPIVVELENLSPPTK